MTMIQPLNGHLIIEPQEQKGFIASSKEVYDEIGIVLALPAEFAEIQGTATIPQIPISVGDKVYFDGWLAAKYPIGDGEKMFWLVRYEDIRAVEKES